MADSSSPELAKWFLDRDEMDVYMIFSEPVTMLNCSQIRLNFSSYDVSLGDCSPLYLEFGVKLVVNIEEALSSMGADWFSLIKASDTGDLDLSIADSTVEDLAAIPNTIRAVRFAHEIGPGTSDCIY